MLNKNVNILLVEDEKDSSKFYKNILNNIGFKNFAVLDSFKGLDDTPNNNKPELVILDITSSNENKSFNLIQQFVQKFLDTPLIVVLPSFKYSINNLLKHLPCSQLFIKPIDLPYFAQTVNHFIIK